MQKDGATGGSSRQRILVTGATGHVGRPLVEQLRSLGAQVRAVTRRPREAAWLPDDVEVVKGDPSRPDSLASAMRGITGLFLNPMAVQDATGPLLALAREHGVGRVVALSATNVNDDPAEQPSRLRGVNHTAVEEAVTNDALEWVVLRCSVHATNSMGVWAAQIRAGDLVFGPYAASTAAPIDPRDVAEVAARALLGDQLVGTLPEITGPESMTQVQMVAAIGEALGRNLRYQEISPEDAKRAMLGRGFPFPEELIDRLFALLAKSVGKPTRVTREVESILGRRARPYAQWVSDHADVFRAAGRNQGEARS
jgi:uncharacterized protein YbjT (DUF2867 family)